MPTKTRRVFTPALEAARGDLLKYLEAFCYLVISHDGHLQQLDTVGAALADDVAGFIDLGGFIAQDEQHRG